MESSDQDSGDEIDPLGELATVTASLEQLINNFVLVGPGMDGDIHRGFEFTLEEEP
jgi:hypothetical protein